MLLDHQPMMVLLMLSMTVHVKADGVVNKADKLWHCGVLFSTINVALMLLVHMHYVVHQGVYSIHSYFNVLFSFGVNTTATACVAVLCAAKTHTIQLSGHLSVGSYGFSFHLYSRNK